MPEEPLSLSSLLKAHDERDALRAENERLTRTNNQAIERMRIAELREEEEQKRREDAEAAATTLEWQLSEATKEIERLRAREDEWRAWMNKTLDAWSAEVNRLLSQS